MSDTRAYATN